jgi:hypothetical protein
METVDTHLEVARVFGARSPTSPSKAFSRFSIFWRGQFTASTPRRVACSPRRAGNSSLRAARSSSSRGCSPHLQRVTRPAHRAARPAHRRSSALRAVWAGFRQVSRFRANVRLGPRARCCVTQPPCIRPTLHPRARQRAARSISRESTRTIERQSCRVLPTPFTRHASDVGVLAGR